MRRTAGDGAAYRAAGSRGAACWIAGAAWLAGCTGEEDWKAAGPHTSGGPVDTQIDSEDSGDSGAVGLSDAELRAFAAEVSEAELTATISDLQGFGSRNYLSDRHGEAQTYLVGRFEALGLPVEEDAFEVRGTGCANLIARVEGEDPSKVWIFSAHYDSTSREATTDAPGADDNASGVAAVLEAARVLKDRRLRHSVWFVLTDAEEEGSLGSAQLVSWLPSAGVEVQGVIAPDMIGYWPLGDGDAFDILGDTASIALAESMSDVADRVGVANKVWIDHFYCYGDDHTNFQESDIPAISPMDCVEAHNLPASGEDTPHYHQTSDTLDTLHMPFTTRVAGVITATLALWAGATL